MNSLLSDSRAAVFDIKPIVFYEKNCFLRNPVSENVHSGYIKFSDILNLLQSLKL